MKIYVDIKKMQISLLLFLKRFNNNPVFGRLQQISTQLREHGFLMNFLSYVKGLTSHENLITFNGITFETF